MKTTVNSRGQTVIPAPLRRRYRIGAGSALKWIDTGRELRVIPSSPEVVSAPLRGLTRRNLLAGKLRVAQGAGE
jgi:AbrB family looped-hinge helix DNA binding protein